MIRTVNLTKIFSANEVETHALNGVDFMVGDGEFVAIMGPSGCGKSTLLNILGMLDSPSGGDYFFANENVARFSEKKRSVLRKQRIGFIFQNFNLIDELTIYENIELPLIYLRHTQAARREAVFSIMEQLEIAHRSRHFPLQLSGGQQQRVAIARAVVANPSLILADEPTGNLDSAKGEDVMNLLTKLNEKGTSIVMVTHSMRDAEYSSRIINLFDGKIVNERL
jgi:putative ABC transport system ATP-binding protein